MVQLRGMTWNHERGIAPLLAASKTMAEQVSNLQISWDARSLSDFEQYPLELLAEQYDLIMIDHPHVGSAYDNGLLLPLDELLTADYLADQKRQSVGLSYESYYWHGKQWALPADAAAQIAAYREDLLAGCDVEAPRTWEELLRLAEKLRERRSAIGLPLVPVHAFATFFTLCAQICGRSYWSEGLEVPHAVGDQALGMLQELYTIAHPVSAELDPIGMYERMCSTDEIAYSPFIYGYSNYARAGFRANTLRCVDIPSGSGEPRGSMIGGVGLAISSRCKHPQLAAQFLQMTVSGDYQRGEFFTSGGQPGHRAAWVDPSVNAASNNFFAGTLQTLDLGSMRPRYNGYVDFQDQAGHTIRDFLRQGAASRKHVLDQLNAMHAEKYID